MRCARRRDHVRHGARGVLVPGGVRAAVESHAAAGERSQRAVGAAAERRCWEHLEPESIRRACWTGAAGLRGAALVEARVPRAYLRTRGCSRGCGPTPTARLRRSVALSSAHQSGSTTDRCSHRRSSSGWCWNAPSDNTPKTCARFFFDRLIIPELRQGGPSGASAARSRTPVVRHWASSETPPAPTAARDRSTWGCRAKSRSSAWSTSSASGRLHRRGSGRLARCRRLGPAGLRDLRHALSRRTAARAGRSAGDLRRLRPGPCGPERRRALRATLRQPLATGAAAEQPRPGRARRPGRTVARLRHSGRPCARRRLAATVASKPKLVAMPS